MIENKKILFLGHKPPPLHGASLVGRQIIKILLSTENVRLKSINVNIFFSKSNNIFFKPFYLIKFPILIFNLIFKLVFYRPNIIYMTPSVNSYGYYRDLSLFFIVYCYKKFTKSKVFCHIHMRPLILKKNALAKYSWLIFMSQFELILLSKYLHKEFLKLLPKDAIVHVLPNSTPAISYNHSASNKKVVLFIGHITHSKGAFRLLELSNRFNESVKFIFAGPFISDKDKISFFNHIDNNKLKNVEYAGVIKDDVKDKYFNIASVLAIPSFSEALPLVMIEAFSCGLPVVANKVGGLNDYVNETNGAICNFNEFEKALKLVLVNGRGHYHTNCIDTYKKNFTEDVFKKRLLTILDLNH
jgi:glycosyltransferase involved in cell wall biosynthesis